MIDKTFTLTCCSTRQELLTAIYAVAEPLEQTGRIEQTKNFCQHGDCSVFEHCANVAYVSCALFMKLHINANWDELIRGALLHDYFLYDWHKKEDCHPAHAVYHPTLALKNARLDYELSEKEEDIILHHMFPLTILPPKSREAWMVCLADKICAVMETFGKVLVRQ